MSLKHIKKQFKAFFNRVKLGEDVEHLKRQLNNLNRDIISLHVTIAALSQELQKRGDQRYSDPLRLNKYATSVCSQGGEDGIIHEIFKRIQTTDRVFVEVGVGDGSENNTAFLLSQGWTGFWIDGDGSFIEKLKQREDLQGGCINGKATFITKENIKQTFQQLSIPLSFDFLSLDIDQNTYYIWEALKEYKPRLVVIEYNAVIPPDVDWKVNYKPDRVWDGTQNFGASLKAFENLGRKLGYCLVGCDYGGANAFFVREDLAGDLFAKPYTAENHYEPVRFNSLFYQEGHPTAILDRMVKSEAS